MTGPPRSIWLRKIGTTLPEEASTLPKRTLAKRVPGCLWPAASTIHSAIAFEAPITVFGLTALSVEIRTKRSTFGGGGGLGRDPGRDRVVADRLQRVGLHQRHVLVGGGVEDDARA